MPYQLSAEHLAIRRAVREFGDEEIRPVAREHDEHRRYPEEIVQHAAELDLVAPHLPERYGGAGMDSLETTIITEELWRSDPGIGSAISSRGFGSRLILDHGSERMKEEWLPTIPTGGSICACAISEPNHGSNVAGMETEATRDGDEWVLNGRKMWITNGSRADVTVVFAKTDPGEGHRGISAFLVPTEIEGVWSERIDNKLGIHASDLGEVGFDDARVPAECLIGEENQGFYYLMEFFNSGRVEVAAQALGTGQAALDAALQYAQDREQFDRPVASFQAIRHTLASMRTKLAAARAVTYWAATALEADERPIDPEPMSIAKLFTSERAVEVTDDAIQIFGGAGYVSDHPVERYYRDARITKIYEGTSEIQRNIIADSLIG